MANEEQPRDMRPLIALILIVAISIIAVLPFVLSSWFLKAPRTPVIAPTVPPSLTRPLPPPTPVSSIEVVPTPTPPLIVPSVQQPELVAPSIPTPLPAVRAEVVEVKEHVAKTADDLSETIEQFRKEADDLDLGE